MGEAKQRGTFDERRQSAMMLGRVKRAVSGLRLKRPHPIIQAAVSAVLGPLARASHRSPKA